MAEGQEDIFEGMSAGELCEVFFSDGVVMENLGLFAHACIDAYMGLVASSRQAQALIDRCFLGDVPRPPSAEDLRDCRRAWAALCNYRELRSRLGCVFRCAMERFRTNNMLDDLDVLMHIAVCIIPCEFWSEFGLSLDYVID